MAKVNRYLTTGFHLLGQLDAGGLRKILCATVDIAKGDVLHEDGNGKATNATTDFANTFLGVAAEPMDNSPDVTLSVQYIPPLMHYQFIVAVADPALITQTAVGLFCDMSTVNTLDIDDNTTGGWAFKIDEIDVSAAAVAANTYGFAIGHFFNEAG